MKSAGLTKLCLRILLLPILFMIPALRAQELNPNPEIFSGLHYRFVGPGGNRVTAVVGVPGDLNIYYAGAASGGVWKSFDGGIHWTPIFDKEPAQSIGDITIAPSDHNIVWVGTGEPFIRSNVSIGDGVYKSTDAGKTWTHMGLTKSGRISRVVIDPKNPDIVLVAAEGNCYGPQQERGVFRTTDGGKTWKRVLFVNENTGASDLSMDPDNPRILLAGMWQYVIHTWGQESGGPGSGVWMSRDEGETWEHLTNGLPKPPVGKIAVGIAQSDPNVMYALIETGGNGRGSLWRSDNGGSEWHVVSYNRMLNERPHYYTRLMISPDNANEVYFPSNEIWYTLDGGRTAYQTYWGGDNHTMWADPTNANRMMIGCDVGLFISTTHGKSWHHIILPIGQMYHVAVDNQIPYDIYGNMQDDESVRGPSNTRTYGGIPSSIWATTAGCESGFSYPDPVDNNIVWGNCYAGEVDRFNLKTGETRSVSPWPSKSLDSPAGVLKYRWNWTMPLAIDPLQHNTVYVGSQYVHRTTDAGQSWEVISPDLTLNDHSHMGSSGGLTPDNLGVEYWGTLVAIAVSPVKEGVIWTGSNDGLVHVTTDGGKSWKNVTKNIPALPPYGTVGSIEASHFDPATAYISVNFHQMDNRDPYIYKTTDYGKSWTSIGGGIPKSVFSYVHRVIEDPFRKGMLFAGTENSIYTSFDDGIHWILLNINLPHVPVSWMVIQKHFHDLVLATKGRGFWILDDIEPLEQLSPEVLNSPEFLFKLRPAYRFRSVSVHRAVPDDPSTGQNPRYGADINYFLKSVPEGNVTITIIDSAGNVVRTFEGTKEAGINRVYWNLRYPSVREVKLRTTPESYPQIWSDSRFIGKKTRRIYHWGIEPTLLGALAEPGTYTVKLTVAGKTLTQSLTVLKDPHSEGTLADIKECVKLWRAIDADIDTVVGMINSIERVRKQIEDLPVYIHGLPEASAIVDSAKALDEKIQAVEDTLFQKYLAADDEKTYAAPMELYMKFLWLAGEVGDGAGDVAGNPDFAPTDQDVTVFKILEGRLANAESQYAKLMTSTIPSFNNMLREKGILAIILNPMDVGGMK
ncbi:MAG TPA: sialidase [Candidatus Kryptobacter bacterium]|nr:sialidase [Candidatus Kryptobacter bacterium]